MNLTILVWLRSPPGQALLAELSARDLAETDVLRESTRLRATYPAELARAAIEQTLLRRRAQAKFRSANQLFFIREALEQASSEAVATYRAQRFVDYAYIADVCCGIGGDALALAASGRHVTAVDRDELRLALASANAEALGVHTNITFVCRDVLVEPPPFADALFCDPGRRTAGRRRFHVEQYEPPLSHILAWRTHTPALAVKLSPGIDTSELADVEDCELEFISLDGELKEATLWCGPLATTRQRATVLRTEKQWAESHALAEASPTANQTPGTCSLVERLPRPTPPLTQPRSVLYEPDPAVIRAGLVAELAEQLGAAQIDTTIAYLTADEVQPTPFARAWTIIEWLPFNLKQLRARLRALDAGTVTVKKRGSPLDTDKLARQLSSNGKQLLVVVLTRVAGQPAALICANP